MTTLTSQTQREQILHQAEAYRRQGYTVLLRPDPEELPDFLQPYRPALVVEREDDRAIIEIQSRTSLTPSISHYLQTLAQVVAQHPGWRLELITTAVEDTANPATSDVPPLIQAWTIKDIQQRLPRLQLLSRTDPEVALLYGWSLAEAILRLLADQEGMSANPHHGLTLAKQVVMEGLIDRELYQVLLDLARHRNAIAHGFQFQSSSEITSVLQQMLNTIETLLLDLAGDPA